MSVRSLLAAVCIVCLAAWVIAQEALPGADPLAAAPPTDARHYSYAIGLQIGESFRKDQMELDADSVLAGLKDGLAGAKPLYPEDLCGVAIQRMYREQRAGFAKRNEAFLADNAQAEGVVTLPSGLQYKVLAQGSGRRSPQAADTVRVHYVGRFIDGTIFDQSGGEPAEFQVGGVIDGWVEALQLMKVGDKWELYVPSKLGYPEGNADIPPGATLIFEVELAEIQ